jgi:hypothetical protein
MSLSLPRPILLALVGLVAISAAFVATRGKKEETPAPSSASSATLATPSKFAKPKRHAPAKKAATGTDTPAKATKTVDAAAVTGLPGRVAEALGKRNVVVLFFSQPGPADDTATRGSVRALDAQHGVSVFSDKVRNLSRYHRIVGDLGVAEAPAIVIIGRDLKARLVEGFVDKDSLLQQVKDARR